MLEVREILNQKVSVFSGEEFNVDSAAGLNGDYDFLVSRSPEQLAVEAPVIVVIEAKQENIKLGLGQCAATLVAAQKFNQDKQQAISILYGSVSTGTAWRFLKLEGKTLTLDLTDYPVPPIAQILGMLVWMVHNG